MELALRGESTHCLRRLPILRRSRSLRRRVDKIPAEQKVSASAPAPSYNAETKTSCNGVELVILLDTGATCGSLTKWLFLPADSAGFPVVLGLPRASGP